MTWDLQVEAAFGVPLFDEPTAWTRLDIDNGVRSLRYIYGKGKRRDPLNPAEAVLTLSNINGRLDPLNPTSPYFPNVKRDTQVRLRVDSKDTSNLLSLDQAASDPKGGATSVNGWENNLAATLSVSPKQPGDGERSIRVVATAQMRVSIRTPGTGVNGFPVTGNTLYTIQGAFVTEFTSHSPTFSVQWYTSTGALISDARSPLLPSVQIAAFATRYASFTSPSNARFVRIITDFATTDSGNGALVNDVFYLRRVSLAKGSYKPWTIPGGIYPFMRGHALTWDSRFDVSLKDATCELTVTDITRVFAGHNLWPSVAELAILGNFIGAAPERYYAFDERANQHNVYDVVEKVKGWHATTTNDVRGSADNIMQWDSRPFKSFGGGGGQGAQTAFVDPLTAAELATDWAIDLNFRVDRAFGSPHQIIFTTTDNSTKLYIWTDGTLNFEVTYTNGSVERVTSAFPLSHGIVEHVTAVCHDNGTIHLYINNFWLGGQAGNGRTPRPWGNFLIFGASTTGENNLKGEIGRVCLFTRQGALAFDAQHTIYDQTIKDPWGMDTTTGDRMEHLLADFRALHGYDGQLIPETYPGIPTALRDVGWDQTDVAVQPMNPAGRTMLEYMRAVEATEAGYLKVRRDGIVRLRRRLFTRFPRAAGVTFDNRGTTGTVPYMRASVASEEDIVTAVSFSRTGAESDNTVKNAAAVVDFGEVTHTLPRLESRTPELALQAAKDVLNMNGAGSPLPRATVSLRPDDPRVGWAAALLEPGSSVQLVAELVHYTHSAEYEILEVRHDATTDSGWMTTLDLVGRR